MRRRHVIWRGGVGTELDCLARTATLSAVSPWETAGNGTSSHLSAVMLMQAVGVKMTHIPFRGTTDELAAMVGGQIHLAIDSMTTIWPVAKSGEVRALAVTTLQRVAGPRPADPRAC